ncbi:lysM and putative peptidoglycan-binding domain-containing protein 1 [Pelodiscus sinensis]|uniref:LysM and putative peptidoglycan-binding domain-containing protein 1 n=1 Tax=Pelodiscus sinensis TaxID=13735 RepID=K7GHD6_PELSI|nr:lysM and putative peptidoglycan-binding domain-containing protein 1 isoform X1 [Pelodiscus sinensis]XP_025035914.1 lysM and putative peptidoglycan-binding domain-containing protein 1 isoform X2 [Pelodiscus sinensis]|eukprot:XP_014424449.1 lysM and putative peptidoglycan-binding domain-containing protein 1 isoform X1 [Pelodiscus sinensis]
MASPSRQGSPGGAGLLCGSRTRSYGSLIKSTHSPVRERRVEHRLEPGDTLQGLALKYGVTMEQIKRANRLYTSDSIFLKTTLHIPVLVEPEEMVNGLKREEGATQPATGKETLVLKNSSAASAGSTPRHDLSATDFLRKLDSEINLSKKAAVKKLREGETTIAGMEPGASRTIPCRSEPSPSAQQRSLLGPVPLTKTTRAATLRDKEDEIFTL